MSADAPATEQEMADCGRVLDAWRVGPLYKSELLQQATDGQTPLRDLVRQAVAAGRLNGLPNPVEELVRTLVDAANVDGTMRPKERGVIEQVAREAGMDDDALNRIVGL